MKWKYETIEVIVKYRIGYADEESRKESIRQIKKGGANYTQIGRRSFSIKRLAGGRSVLEAKP